LEAEVVDADAANVYVSNRTGQRYRVPRKDVAEVDHPGNVLFMVGVTIVALGAGMYFDKDGVPGDSEEEVRNAHITGLVFSVPGALMAAWGSYSWWTFQRIEGRRGKLRPSPVPGIAVASPADVVVLPAPVPAPPPVAPGSPEAFAPKQASP